MLKRESLPAKEKCNSHFLQKLTQLYAIFYTKTPLLQLMLLFSESNLFDAKFQEEGK